MRQKGRAPGFKELLSVLLASAAAATAAAQVTPIDASPAPNETLKKLHDCLFELPKHSGTSYVSPCASMNLTNLNGVHLNAMTAALGAPTFCTKPYAIGASHSKGCLSPAWSFYRLPQGWVGGGPELVCSTDDGLTCHHVNWMHTQ